VEALVLGGGGFIGSHMVERLKQEGFWVRAVDLKNPEYSESSADEFIIGDLRDPLLVGQVVNKSFDEIYQFAADMGGAGFIFTGENDANILHNSALVNLNVLEAVKKNKPRSIFYSSSACIYPGHNQQDPDNPNCAEDTAYPANPDSEYGWEKLFSERLFLAFMRNYGLNVRIARFHNIFGPYGTWVGGKEKAPAALCRKVCEMENNGEIEVWGDGKQTRSFLYIDDCVNAILKLMDSDFTEPVNIGSEEMVSINELAKMTILISEKNIRVKNLYGQEFFEKYGHKCPIGVKGRNSDNNLFTNKVGDPNYRTLFEGLKLTYEWINKQITNND
jgi:GDP-D-mannose 3',5'-epimerase